MAAYWTSSSGRLELVLTREQAECGYHPGQCDRDIAELRTVRSIADQMAAFDPVVLARELREYGAWDDAELANHDENQARMLWLACGDLVDATDPETNWGEVPA